MIKDGTALERLAEVDTVIFDKTGTLTLGMPAVALDHPGEAATVAAALAAGWSHRLARALAYGARAAGIVAAEIADIREVPGFGIEGLWNGAAVRVGRVDWCGAEALAETATYLRLDAVKKSQDTKPIERNTL